MKQGKPSISGSYDKKIEPLSRAINPGGAANLGRAHGNHSDDGEFTPKITPMDAGRGFSAPGIGATVHKSGSQGKR